MWRSCGILIHLDMALNVILLTSAAGRCILDLPEERDN